MGVNAADASDMDSAVDVFEEHRRRIFGIAYRMLGTVADAEDIVQETWIRWQNTDRDDVVDPGAFLATIATRLSINATQSARARRETYIGPWLPEPVNTQADPALGAERGEALQFAIMLTLEKLTPTERAAYILREALDYPYERIAEIVGATVASARQLVSRARKHLASARRAEVEASHHRRLLEAFLVAAQNGDVTALEELFAADVVSYTDGNGVKLAARIPMAGRRRVAQFIASWSSHFWLGKTVELVQVNGRAAVAILADGAVVTTCALTTTDDGIAQIFWTMSPDKLASWNRR